MTTELILSQQRPLDSKEADDCTRTRYSQYEVVGVREQASFQWKKVPGKRFHSTTSQFSGNAIVVETCYQQLAKEAYHLAIGSWLNLPGVPKDRLLLNSLKTIFRLSS